MRSKRSYRPTRNTFMVTPTAASVHTIETMLQPHAPPTLTSMIGVYVAAMST